MERALGGALEPRHRLGGDAAAGEVLGQDQGVALAVLDQPLAGELVAGEAVLGGQHLVAGVAQEVVAERVLELAGERPRRAA